VVDASEGKMNFNVSRRVGEAKPKQKEPAASRR